MEATTDRELLELERGFWDAMKKRDAASAAKLTDESCLVAGPQGIGELTRATIGKMVESASYELTDYSLGDYKVRRLSDDVVICAYKVKERLVVDGATTQLEAYDTSVWVKKDGDWVCAMHTEALAGDPFGRDKRPGT